MAKPSYTITTRDSLIILIDKNEGISITNAAEQVVEDLYSIFGLDLHKKRIIYRDTEGVWDGLHQVNGRFERFIYIGYRNRELAIELALTSQQWPI